MSKNATKVPEDGPWVCVHWCENTPNAHLNGHWTGYWDTYEEALSAKLKSCDTGPSPCVPAVVVTALSRLAGEE